MTADGMMDKVVALVREVYPGGPVKSFYQRQQGTCPESWARQVAMPLCWEIEGLTTADVGAYFVGRDGSTVRAARQTVFDVCDVDEHTAGQVDRLRSLMHVHGLIPEVSTYHNDAAQAACLD